ncbi:MAG TPA: hypothetical protein PK869_01060 [Candidatus Hydrogenedentes bacterium]|nr:hypothetical protein [Candidatus Hydrogenedentota bacterium]
MRAILYGAEVDAIRPHVERHAEIEIVDSAPDVVVCYGGDGTLLSSELKWPGIPKVPIRNSRRGNRCIPHPAAQVIERLINGKLTRTEFVKIGCAVYGASSEVASHEFTAMNEFNVHMGHINLAVRFKIWLDNEPYDNGSEIIGDGFVVSTPFGSTAYFNQITRGVFHAGLGLAFKNITELTSHVIVPDTTVVRAVITRGPGVLAYDNAPDYIELKQGDRLEIRKHATPATVLTWATVARPTDAF